MKVAFLVMLLQIKSTAMKIFLGAESGDSRMASTALEQGAKLAKRTADAGAAAEVEDVVGHIDDSDDDEAVHDEVVDAANRMATDVLVWRGKLSRPGHGYLRAHAKH